MENSFSKTMHNKSDDELQQILNHQDDYTFEALQAVVWELEKRGKIEKGEVILEKPKEEVKKSEEPKIHQKQILPTLYSKASIFGFTIFFSTIFGAVLLMQNFTKMGQYKARNQVLTFGIAFTLLNVFIISSLPPNFLTTLAVNVLGYLILSEVFWNRILGKDIQYKKKSIRTPLLISIAILFLFVILQLIVLQFMGVSV